MRSAVTLAILFSTTTALAQKTELAPAQVRKVERLIAETMKDAGIPGLSAAIATDNRLVYAKGFGKADVENDVAATAQTRYRTASIAKSMTAVAAMSLKQDGKLDLDKPVQEYCSEYPKKRWPVTTRQLLGHLSGVRHYKARAETTQTRHYPSLSTALDTFKGDPLLHEPETRYLYSTFGYNLAGSVMEGAAGEDFMTILEHRVFKPAGMQETVADNHFTIVPNRTRGYLRFGGAAGVLRNAPMHDTSVKIPGGGLLSTSPDLVRFAIAVNTGRLLRDSTRREMWTEQETRAGRGTGYGLGWGVGTIDGMQLVSHTGGQAGTSTILLLLPEKGTAVALMCNLQGAGLRDLAKEIAGALRR